MVAIEALKKIGGFEGSPGKCEAFPWGRLKGPNP
jgi:hypothetical protein